MGERIYKYRITYKKTGPAKYIGHLDLLRIFQRAVRLSGVKPCYSEGFNPHMILSFAQPLSVGMEALEELADTAIRAEAPGAAFLKGLNASLPDGILAVSAERMDDGAKTAAALVRQAVYRINAAYEGEADLADAAREILSSREVMVQTERHGRADSVNVRDRIYALSAERNMIYARIACGGSGNLRPDVLAARICSSAGVVFDPYGTEYCRECLILKGEKNI